MCMEDIRLGRALASQSRFVQVAAGSPTLICSADTRRTRVALHNSSVTMVVVNFQQQKTSTDPGIPLRVDNPPLLFRIEEYGSMVTGEIWGYGDGAGVDIVVVESTLEREK